MPRGCRAACPAACRGSHGSGPGERSRRANGTRPTGLPAVAARRVRAHAPGCLRGASAAACDRRRARRSVRRARRPAARARSLAAARCSARSSRAWLVTPEQLEETLAIASQTGARLGDLLIARGLVRRIDVYRACRRSGACRSSTSAGPAGPRRRRPPRPRGGGARARPWVPVGLRATAPACSRASERRGRPTIREATGWTARSSSARRPSGTSAAPCCARSAPR